jgi:hypothetical protein
MAGASTDMSVRVVFECVDHSLAHHSTHLHINTNRYCRANIPEDTTTTTTTTTPRRRVPSPRAQQQQGQQQQQQDNNNDMLPGFDGNGRPMMPPDEAARRAAFTSRNMRNIRFMTQPRRFPPPSTSQTDQQEEEKEEKEETTTKTTNESSSNSNATTPANFQLPVAAPVTPRLLQQISASSTTSTSSISTPALRVTPSFGNRNVRRLRYRNIRTPVRRK